MKKSFLPLNLSILSLLLLSSCASPSPINIEILKNYESMTISSIGIIYTVDLPLQDNITYDVKCDIGHINSDPTSLKRKIFKENEELFWVTLPSEVTDENNTFYKYGFIEGLILKNEVVSGYFLLGIKNHSKDISFYEYKIEIVSKLYDESLGLDTINKMINENKNIYINNL